MNGILKKYVTNWENNIKKKTFMKDPSMERGLVGKIFQQQKPSITVTGRIGKGKNTHHR